MNKSFLVSVLVALSAQGAFADARATYPTLGALCDAAQSRKESKLALATIIFSPFEVWTLNMDCGYFPASFDGVSFSVTQFVTSGASQFSQDIKGFARVEQTTANGSPELDIAFVSEHVKIGVRDFLRLNSQGQPVMTVDRFDGTLDPSEAAANDGGRADVSKYNSGTLVQEDAVAAQKSCSELAQDGQDQAACGSAQATQIALPVSSKNYNPVAVNLGWLATASPTNTHLDQPSTRVDFQVALRELTAAGTNVSDDDFAAVLKATKDNLAQGEN
jgi:hypothetical protein